MLDPRDFPAFWGLCGGMLFGAVGLVTAYSAKAGNPLAQRKAWLHLGLGVVAGPILAEAFTPSLIAVVPALDMRGVAMTLGNMLPGGDGSVLVCIGLPSRGRPLR